MANEETKKLTLEDCKIDWDNYREKDMYGCVDDDPHTYEESKAHYKRICDYSPESLISRDQCFDYFFFGYYPDLLSKYCEQEKISDRQKEIRGLVRMFNEDWITSPVYVNWRNSDIGFYKDIIGYSIEHWLFSIHDAQKQVDILRHLIKNADYIYGWEKRMYVPHLKALLDKCAVVAKEQKEHAQKMAAAQKGQSKQKKEKPEYILSLDEIIQYVREENTEAAPSIRAMLRYFAFEKEGWSNTNSLDR